MTLEEYNQLSYDYAHCAGTHCEKASQCLRHTAYTMLEMGGREQYMMVNSKVIADKQPCPFFDPTARNVLHGEYYESMTTCGWLRCAKL